MLITGAVITADTGLYSVVRSEPGLCSWTFSGAVSQWKWTHFVTQSKPTRGIHTGSVCFFVCLYTLYIISI